MAARSNLYGVSARQRRVLPGTTQISYTPPVVARAQIVPVEAVTDAIHHPLIFWRRERASYLAGRSEQECRARKRKAALEGSEA